MTERDHSIIPSLPDLSQGIAGLEARIAAIEEHLGLESVTESSALPLSADSRPDEPGLDRDETGFHLPALGTTLLLLAGAFLLRAITDSGLLSPAAGVSLGLAYILVLFFLTDRHGRLGRFGQAALTGTASVLVAFPFVWETAMRHGILPGTASAGLAALVLGLGLATALRHDLRTLAGFVLLAGLALCVGLYWNGDAPFAVLIVLLTLGGATVHFADALDWSGPRWLVAAVVNTLVVVNLLLAAHPVDPANGRPTPSTDGALLAALALPAVYLAAFAWRTLVRRRAAGAFEIVQSPACILAGLAGAVHLLHVGGHGTTLLGWPVLVVALTGYVVAFILVRERQGRGQNFFYFAWLGLLLTLLATALTTPRVSLPYLWAGLAAAVAVTGGVFDRWTLRLHCAAYLLGASAVAGVGSALYAAFMARSVPTTDNLTPAVLTVWVLTALCYVLMSLSRRGRGDAAWRRAPRFMAALLALCGAGIVAVTLLSAPACRLFPDHDTAVMAALRTAVLAVVTVLLAALGRRRPVAELAWLVGPLLILLGVKMLLEDLRSGTPVSLCFGFACFGAALIIAPRLRPRGAGQEPTTDPAAPGVLGEGIHGTETT